MGLCVAAVSAFFRAQIGVLVVHTIFNRKVCFRHFFLQFLCCCACVCCVHAFFPLKEKKMICKDDVWLQNDKYYKKLSYLITAYFSWFQIDFGAKINERT